MNHLQVVKRPLKNGNFCSSSRNAKILITGILWNISRIYPPPNLGGLKFEPDAEIGQISADFEKCRFAKVS
jgi:hypothetical protein